MHVAGASSEGPDENIAHLGEELLKPIAAQIDKTLHLTLFPNKVDSNLLDSGLQDTIVSKLDSGKLCSSFLILL
jgi:hypothetical protein